jgi:hypothetical protein
MSGAKNTNYARFVDFHGRNPDVLNSIANLSSDEVFTPPEFVNGMLDTLEKAWAESNNEEVIWQNSKLTFLDPFTKSGVFLREISSRLIKGLESQIPDLQDRVDHVLTRQVFGIATTKLTSLMARRSVYCSKVANGKNSVTKKFTTEEGNIWFEPIDHTWVGGKTKVLTMDDQGNEIEKPVNSKCKFCGASTQDLDRDEGLEQHAYGLIHNEDPKGWVRGIFGEEVKFDVIVGNPPYQLEDGGFAASAAPIYDKFVESAMALEPTALVMVVPARWYSGGKGLDSFRSKMIQSTSFQALVDYPDSSKVFPGVEIKGGVCYFLWNKGYSGEAEITTIMPDGQKLSDRRTLRTGGLDVFIRFPAGVSVLEKVSLHHAGKESGLSFFDEEDRLFRKRVSSRKPYGLPTNFRGASHPQAGSLRLFQNGGIGYIQKEEVLAGQDLINSWKIFVSKAYGAGNDYPHSILGQPFIGEPGTVCTETYLAIGPFADEKEARSALSYISTKFFRFLVMLHKPAQDAARSVYSLVPDQDFSRIFSDEYLYSLYGLSDAEISFIDDLVRPMELS